MYAKFAASVVMVGALLAPSAAFAQQPASEKALAEALFLEARSLIEAKRFAEACPKLAESHRIEPKLGTLLYLATCHEQTGKLASAWAEYGEAATLAARGKEREREKLASERARAIEPRLARLRVVLPSDDIELSLDGRTLSAASASVPLPVDAGTHVLIATAPQRKPWRVEVVAVDGDVNEVVVPSLAPLEEAPPPPAPAPPPAVVPPPASGGLKTGTIVLGGVAVVGAVAGSVAGLQFFSQRRDGLSACNGDRCTQQGLDDLDAARTSSLISGVGFAVFGAAAAGAIIVQLSGSSSDVPRAALRAGPRGVVLGGTW